MCYIYIFQIFATREYGDKVKHVILAENNPFSLTANVNSLQRMEGELRFGRWGDERIALPNSQRGAKKASFSKPCHYCHTAVSCNLRYTHVFFFLLIRDCKILPTRFKLTIYHFATESSVCLCTLGFLFVIFVASCFTLCTRSTRRNVRIYYFK